MMPTTSRGAETAHLFISAAVGRFWAAGVQPEAFARSCPSRTRKAGGATSKNPPRDFNPPKRVVRQWGTRPRHPPSETPRATAGQAAFCVRAADTILVAKAACPAVANGTGMALFIYCLNPTLGG